MVSSHPYHLCANLLDTNLFNEIEWNLYKLLRNPDRKTESGPQSIEAGCQTSLTESITCEKLH
jgi:hypothetical protein